jgi:hypothetical protein
MKQILISSRTESLLTFQRLRFFSTEITQLTQLDAEAVGQMLPLILQQWRGKDELSMVDASKTGLSRGWLTQLWRYLCTHFPTNLQRFEYLHLIPQSNDILVPLDKSQPILARKASSYLSILGLAQSLPSEVITICNQMGIRIIDNVDTDVTNHPQIWNSYILPPTAQGFLEAMIKLQAKLGKQTFLSRFQPVSNDSRRRLKEFLASGIKGVPLSDGGKQVLEESADILH